MQVFAILLQYIAVRSWSAAFETVIPLRKYQSIKGTARSQKDNVEEDDKLSNDEDDGDDRLLGEDVDGDTEEALMNA